MDVLRMARLPGASGPLHIDVVFALSLFSSFLFSFLCISTCLPAKSILSLTQARACLTTPSSRLLPLVPLCPLSTPLDPLDFSSLLYFVLVLSRLCSTRAYTCSTTPTVLS